jgi:hypothetical protein
MMLVIFLYSLKWHHRKAKGGWAGSSSAQIVLFVGLQVGKATYFAFQTSTYISLKTLLFNSNQG